MARKQTALDNGLAMFCGTCLNILISLITTPIITRLVAPSDYGQWSLFTTYSNVAMAIVMLGLDQAFVRFYYKDERIEYKRYLSFTAIKIPITICFVLFVLSFGFISDLELFENNNYVVYLLLYLNVVIAVINRIAQLILRMEQRGREYSVLIVLNKIIYLIIAFSLIFLTNLDKFIVLTLGTVVAQLFVTFCAIRMGRTEWKMFEPCPAECPVHSKDLILYGLPFIYAMLASDIFNAADKWTIKAVKTYSDVGIYAAAANIVAICSVVQTTFALLWSPLAIEHYEKNSEDKSFYIKANGCITVAMFSLGALVICFKDAIVLLLGGKYSLAATVVPFLLFNPIMNTVSETTVYGINFKNKTWYHMIITSVSAITNVLLNSWLVPIFSSEGAALATAISYTLFFSMRTLLSRHCYPIRFPLKKFAIITALFMLYAMINTFLQPTLLINLLMLLAFFSVLAGLYKNSVGLLVTIGYREVKKRIMRK